MYVMILPHLKSSTLNHVNMKDGLQIKKTNELLSYEFFIESSLCSGYNIIPYWGVLSFAFAFLFSIIKICIWDGIPTFIFVSFTTFTHILHFPTLSCSPPCSFSQVKNGRAIGIGRLIISKVYFPWARYLSWNLGWHALSHLLDGGEDTRQTNIHVQYDDIVLLDHYWMHLAILFRGEYLCFALYSRYLSYHWIPWLLMNFNSSYLLEMLKIVSVWMFLIFMSSRLYLRFMPPFNLGPCEWCPLHIIFCTICVYLLLKVQQNISLSTSLE